LVKTILYREVLNFLVKNATNASQGENYLLTNYYNIFVNPVADPEVGKELKKKI
jgi:hypothetical protein